jgi:hypothetical protein
MTVWNLGGVLVDLLPRFLTSEERAVREPFPEPDTPFNDWLLGRWAQALKSWRRGLPLMLCDHLYAGHEGAVYWFPFAPGTQLCGLCGPRIRAAISATPSPLRRCDACQEDLLPDAWLTTATYGSADWCATALICEDCLAGFGERTSSQMISEGIKELERMANRSVTGG